MSNKSELTKKKLLEFFSKGESQAAYNTLCNVGDATTLTDADIKQRTMLCTKYRKELEDILCYFDDRVIIDPSPRLTKIDTEDKFRKYVSEGTIEELEANFEAIKTDVESWTFRTLRDRSAVVNEYYEKNQKRQCPKIAFLVFLALSVVAIVVVAVLSLTDKIESKYADTVGFVIGAFDAAMGVLGMLIEIISDMKSKKAYKEEDEKLRYASDDEKKDDEPGSGHKAIVIIEDSEITDTNVTGNESNGIKDGSQTAEISIVGSKVENGNITGNKSE